MRLTNCPKCGHPVARQQWVGLSVYLDLTALDHRGLADAWASGRKVWKLHTIHVEQVATYYWPSIYHAQAHTGKPIGATLLVAHQCPGAPVAIPDALATWQPKDAKRYLPEPIAAHTEGVPF
jgi:hypothetical protein